MTQAGPVSSRTRFTVAGAFALVVGGLLAWAIATAWHPLRPRLVCVLPLGNGQTAAYFGYASELDEPRAVPIGEDNYFEPGPPDRHQPTAFPGRVAVGSKDAGFAVAFAGEALTWTLDGRRAVATPDSPRCPMPTPIKEQPDVAWVKPQPAPPPPEPEAPKPEPEPPKPPKPDDAPPPPPPAAQAPRVKPREPIAPKVVDRPPEPVPLALEGLTNLDSGIVIASGEHTALGSPEVEVTKTNTDPQGVGVPDGVPGGVQGGVVGGEAPRVVRTPPKVKVRPRGEWPADAPPRAGAVLVKLSLLVGTDGKVREVKVVKGAGTAFDREARAVGMQAVFTPGTEAGQPVAQWVPWVVEFTPDGG